MDNEGLYCSQPEAVIQMTAPNLQRINSSAGRKYTGLAPCPDRGLQASSGPFPRLLLVRQYMGMVVSGMSSGRIPVKRILCFLGKFLFIISFLEDSFPSALGMTDRLGLMPKPLLEFKLPLPSLPLSCLSLPIRLQYNVGSNRRRWNPRCLRERRNQARYVRGSLAKWDYC